MDHVVISLSDLLDIDRGRSVHIKNWEIKTNVQSKGIFNNSSRMMSWFVEVLFKVKEV